MTADDSTRDLLELRRQLPPPTEITLSPEHRARLARRVHTAIDDHDRGARRTGRVAAPALLVACSTILALLTWGAIDDIATDPRSPSPRDRAVATAPAATLVLESAATAALAAPTLDVREDQFVYTRSAVLSNDGRLGGPVRLGEVHEREVWFGQDTGPYGWDDDVIRELGQDWPIDYSGPAAAGVGRPTYAWLASLPTDPDALLDVLYAEARTVERQEPEQAVFELIGNLVNEQAVPPRTAAAFYRATTLIPGVEVERDATDALGRQGIGVSRADAAFRTRTTWVFDPDSYELMGMRSWFTHTDGSPDILFGATAILERGIVDEAGTVPARPA